VHFLPNIDPISLGHRALAVNLSDLAAVGAEPAWALLALSLPEADAAWLEGFAQGFFALAERYRVDLVGGDTTLGPLAVTVQVLGWVPEAQALKRSAARAGDWVCVSGPLGEAGLGLKMLKGELGWQDLGAVARFLTPIPRVELGLALRGLAHACIDVSDGLAQDLGHVLSASQVGATLVWESLPLSEAVRRYIAETGDWRLPLCAGDDYELCFTVPPQRAPALKQRLSELGLPWHRIGTIEPQPGLRLRRGQAVIEIPPLGYRHF
jgi:thiamine-monophosphate kinase